MMKKTSRIRVKYFCFLSFLLLITAAFVMTAGVTFAQAKKAIEQKALAALVDINSAGQKELEELKGISPATAKKIIDGRPYKSVNDLSKAGLSAKAVESVKPFVTVGKTPAAKSASAAVSGAKVNINTADKAALDVLPGIGPVKAQAIIDGRPYKSIEDVMRVSGIKEKAFEKIKDLITIR